MTGWQESALCAEVGGEMFYPERGESPREAKAVCQRCEVRTECLEDALVNDEEFGIRGGMSRLQRQRIRRGQHETGVAA